jgi:hypothetical protein
MPWLYGLWSNSSELFQIPPSLSLLHELLEVRYLWARALQISPPWLIQVIPTPPIRTFSNDPLSPLVSRLEFISHLQVLPVTVLYRLSRWWAEGKEVARANNDQPDYSHYANFWLWLYIYLWLWRTNIRPKNQNLLHSENFQIGRWVTIRTFLSMIKTR